MVQLKDNFSFHNISINKISIPYGSIKRNYPTYNTYWLLTFQFLMVQLKENKNNPFAQLTEFQFLMVQLKVKTR